MAFIESDDASALDRDCVNQRALTADHPAQSCSQEARAEGHGEYDRKLTSTEISVWTGTPSLVPGLIFQVGMVLAALSSNP